MRSAVRTAPNGPVVRAEHACVVAVGCTALLGVAWLALAVAAELGAIATHHVIVAFPTAADVLSPLLHPSDPAGGLPRAVRAVFPPATVFWLIAALGGVPLAVVAAVAVARLARWATPGRRFRGQATRAAVARLAGETVVRRQSARLRPSVDLRAASADDLALRVGETARDGAAVYMGLQNNLGLVAGPQTGKTTSTMGVIPLRFPGPAIMTETHRPDVMAMSACQSDFDRPVLVLDPENRIGWPEPVGIDILAGCEDYAIAHRRANLIIRAATTRSEITGGNMEFFIGEATTAAAAFLHAARIGETGLGEVLRWTQRWGSQAPIEILEALGASDAARSDAQMLRQLYTVGGPQAAGTAGELRNAFGCLANPNVSRTFGGRTGHSLDVGTFLEEKGRLYVHGSGRDQQSIAPFIALVITEVVEEALARAATAAERRLDPPLLLDLDEVANIAPLPELPYYLSAGAGSGICTVWAAQGRAQLRRRWGADAAREVWQSTNFRVWFGGSVEADALRELESLSGTVWEETISEQDPGWANVLSGDRWSRRSRQRTVHRVPVFTADDLRTLPEHRAVLFARNLAPVELVMRPWWERRDIAALVRESMQRFDRLVAGRPSS